MKANDFVKKYGWDVAQELLKNSWGEKLIVHVGYATDGFELTEIIVKDDLKQLIEAKGLVDSYGGLDEANKIICNAYHGSNHPITEGHEKLSVAIQLIETIENVSLVESVNA